MMIRLAEKGLLPDTLVRIGIRRLLSQRLRREEERREQQGELLQRLQQGPVAVAQQQANEQHYEVDASFYEQTLGRHLKYSCGYWPQGVTTLDEAEEAMLALTCDHAQLHDGQTILELGCGWGALSLWMAEHYPASRITAISNSASQRAFIMDAARRRGLANLVVLTADATDFHTDARFDRVVSVEMFEHMRNHQALLERVHGWLKPGGKLFLHVFCHRQLAYLFEEEGESDWMARHFFTGGIMPSFEWLPACADGFIEQARWKINGIHYARTLEAWLDQADANRETLISVLDEVYGPDNGKLWLQRWRMFFMACAELFNYGGGQEWFVAHYRFLREAE